MGARPETDEDEEATSPLTDLLAALANPARIEILHELRSPRTLSEVRVRSAKIQEGLVAGRLMSRQGVRHHLDVLVAAGFVRSNFIERDGVATEEYVVNHPQLFAIAEEMRVLATLRAVSPLGESETEPLAHRDRALRTKGPALVMVHGLNEGHAFPLEGRGPWSIGRERGQGVTLDHDPFVSTEHARLTRDTTGWWIEDLPRSTNGTTVNWVLVAKGGRVPIESGDVVGVGKTLLLFRA